MSNKKFLVYAGMVLFSLSLILTNTVAHAQRNASGKVTYLVNIIDSLDLVIAGHKRQAARLDSLLRIEKEHSAGLQASLDSLNTERKKLEAKVDGYQGENLKLSQSNRILIVFNSFVALLLIVTLVFYLRKMNRKPAVQSAAPSRPAVSAPPSVHASFEDKLQQLERLGKLREKGFLSDEEFSLEKNRVLGK